MPACMTNCKESNNGGRLIQQQQARGCCRCQVLAAHNMTVSESLTVEACTESPIDGITLHLILPVKLTKIHFHNSRSD